MKEKPLVSVLMTAYNREKYVAAAIESVLASTYTNFELIIVDDGSKDKTIDIIKYYALKDARVKIYINNHNLGDYPNRNKAAAYATGKYLKYVDADDYIYPFGLMVLVSMMEANPEAAWGLCSLPQIVEQPFPCLLTPREAYLHNFFGPGLFYKAPLSSIIKREVFEAVNGFQPLRMVGDFEMWHRLALNYPVLLMPDGVVWCREHNERELNHYRKFITQYEEIQFEYLSHPDCPLNKTEIKKIINKQTGKKIKEFIKAIIKMKKANLEDTYKLMQFYLKKM